MHIYKSLKLGALVLFIVTVAFFAGCGGGTAPPINHYGTARGFVKDAVTRTEIEEAIVTIGDKSNITDSNGAYLIENIPAGSQSIVVTALGYQDYNNSVTIEEGDNVIDDVLLEPGATHYEDTSNSDGIATFTLQDSRVVQTKVIDVVTGEPIPNIDSYLVTDGTDVAFLFIDPAGIYIPRIAPEEQSLRALARPPEERQIGTIKELWKVEQAMYSGYQPKYADQIESHLASDIFRWFFNFCYPSKLGDLEVNLRDFLIEAGLDSGVGAVIGAVLPGVAGALVIVSAVELGNTAAYQLWVEHYTSRGYSLDQDFEIWRLNPPLSPIPFVLPIEEPSNLVIEENPGSISGKVLDALSLGIHNAQVEIVDLDLSTTTSSDGSYSFSSIPPGTYGIVAYKIGYNPSAQVNVRVFSGQETAALSIVLSSISENIILSYITVSPSTMNLVEGDTRTITSITAHYNNGDTADIALDDCTYDSSNPGFATVDTGVVTAVAPGTATITVRYTEGGITKSDNVEVTVTSVAPETYTITSSAGSHGSIIPSGDVIVNQGSDKSFTITPDTGYSIDDVLVDGSSVGAVSSYTFTNVTEDHTISATFSAAATGPVHNLTKDTYYNTIQEALDDADSLGGDNIEVDDGTYNESITFPTNKVVTLQSASGIRDNVIIQGANNFATVTTNVSSTGTTLRGFTITHTGGNTGRGIYIGSGNLIVDNCIISGNTSDDSGGGINNYDGSLTITSSTISGNTTTADQGGGIHNNGTLDITSSNISDNTATRGGGINNYGTLTIASSIISDNTATNNKGGGIYSSVTLTVTGSTISGNTAADSGGGIYNAIGTLTVTGSTISGNTSNKYGGGIGNKMGTLDITSSTISDNTAANHGGGIDNVSGTLTITSSTISSNISYDYGGGICNFGSLTITGGTVSNNSANQRGGGIYNCYDGTLDITSSTISDNTATYGGGIYDKTSDSGTLTITGSNISGNNVSQQGGGIYLEGTGIITIGGESPADKNTICGNRKGANPSLDQQIRDKSGSLHEIYNGTNYISVYCE